MKIKNLDLINTIFNFFFSFIKENLWNKEYLRVKKKVIFKFFMFPEVKQFKVIREIYRDNYRGKFDITEETVNSYFGSKYLKDEDKYFAFELLQFRGEYFEENY